MSRDHGSAVRHAVLRSLTGLLSRYYGVTPPQVRAVPFWLTVQIGRASCRERV